MVEKTSVWDRLKSLCQSGQQFFVETRHLLKIISTDSDQIQELLLYSTVVIQ